MGLLLRFPQMSGSNLVWVLAAWILCVCLLGHLSIWVRVQEISHGVAIIFLMQSTRCLPSREFSPDLGPDVGPYISQWEKNYRASTPPPMGSLLPWLSSSCSWRSLSEAPLSLGKSLPGQWVGVAGPPAPTQPHPGLTNWGGRGKAGRESV